MSNIKPITLKHDLQIVKGNIRVLQKIIKQSKPNSVRRAAAEKALKLSKAHETNIRIFLLFSK